MDPLTFTQISHPVRGDACTHANVFCLRNYLRNLIVSEQRRTKCPFCSKIILKFNFDFIVLKAIEEYYYILNRMQIHDEITFQKNGKYYFTADANPKKPENDEEHSSARSKKDSEEKKKKRLPLDDSVSQQSDESSVINLNSDQSDFEPPQ